MACMYVASYPGLSRGGGGEWAWYTLHVHALRAPEKCGVIRYYPTVYSPFIIHRTVRRAEPAHDH